MTAVRVGIYDPDRWLIAQTPLLQVAHGRTLEIDPPLVCPPGGMVIIVYDDKVGLCCEMHHGYIVRCVSNWLEYVSVGETPPKRHLVPARLLERPDRG